MMSSTLQTASNDPEEQMHVASCSTPHPRVSPEEFAYDNHSCTESFGPLSQLHPEISDVEHAHSNHSSVDLSALPRPVVVPEEHARDNHPKAFTEEHCRDNHPKAASEKHCRDNHPKAVTEEHACDNHPKAVTEEHACDNHPKAATEEHARDNHPKAASEEHCRDNHPKAVTEEHARDNHPKAASEEHCCDNHPKAVTEEHACDNHPKAASEEHCRDNHPKAATEEHARDNHPKAATEDHARDNHTCVDFSVLYHPKATTEEHCRDNHTCVDFSVLYHPKTTSEEHSCDHHSCVEQFSAVSHHPPLSPKEHDCGSNSSVDPSGSVQHHPEASNEQHDSGNRCSVDPSSCVLHHPGFYSEKNACGSHSHADYCHYVCNSHPRHTPGEAHACENHSVVHVSHLPQQNARNISVTPSVETGLPKQQAKRARMICVLVSVLVVILGATISLWVILAGREASRDDVLNNTATIPPPRALDPQMLKDPDFEGSFRMIGTKWISAMSDVNSDAFRTTASKTEQMMDEIYHASNVSDVIAYSVVTSLREGSVIVRFILRLTSLPDLPADPAKAALQQRVKRQPSLLVAAFTEGLGRVMSSVRGAIAPRLSDIIASSVTIRRANTTTISSTTPSSMTTTVTSWSNATTTTTTATTASQTTKLTNEPRPRCGEVRRQPEARIIGGKTAGLGMYPWVVMIRVDDGFLCGGSIMDPVHVVTAAHCFPDVQWPGIVHNTEVVAGELAAEPDRWTEHAQRVSVSRVYRHEHFNLQTQSQYDSNLNDIAVIRLAHPLTFNSYVAPICIPEVNDTLPSTCLVAGWGSNTSSHTQKTFPDELQVVALWTYNNTACQEAFAASFGGVIYGDYISFYLNDGVMCAANHTSGGLDACFGDSGGPLFCFQPDSSGEGGHYAQFGVVSWGEGCALPGSPGFYTYLPYFKTWLDDEAVPKLEFLVNISSARCLSERKCADLMTSLKQAAMPSDWWCRKFTETVDCMLQQPVKDAGCSRDVAVAELWSYLQFLSVPSANSAYNETACTDWGSG